MDIAEFMPRGLLDPYNAQKHFKLTRFEPSEPLKSTIQHYWIVEWDLAKFDSYEQTIVTHPNINLVFEQGNTRLYGVSRATFKKRLEGSGYVVGVKFKPSGFFAYWKQPCSLLTDRSLDESDPFVRAASQLEELVLHNKHQGATLALETLNEFFIQLLPSEIDPNIQLLNQIVEQLKQNSHLHRVEQIAKDYALSIRSLQRLFDRYIGISPKWVICRYRIHEAADRLSQHKVSHWSELLDELGYYDQSHFIRDFKTFTALTPDQYMQQTARGSDGLP